MKMQNLSEKIDDNYIAHPPFKYDEGDWTLPTMSLTQFNQNYIATMNIGTSANMRGWNILCEDLIETLKHIFASLRVQSLSVAKKLFLNEFEGGCTRALNKKLKWFRKLHFSKFIDSTSQKLRNDIIGLYGNEYFFGKLSPIGSIELASLAQVELHKAKANEATGRLKREDLSITAELIQNTIRNELNRKFQSIGSFSALGPYKASNVVVSKTALELSISYLRLRENSIGNLEQSFKYCVSFLGFDISNQFLEEDFSVFEPLENVCEYLKAYKVNPNEIKNTPEAA